MSATSHVPVMAAELVAALAPRDGGIYVDGTFGGGGHSAAILDAADCTVWGIDRDPEAVARSAALCERYRGRLIVILGCFGEMDSLLAAHSVGMVDGVALDVGASSMQLDDPERGFSFRADGPLDMRMGKSGRSAADVVNTLPERELADILYVYGEERAARRIAAAIVEARADHPFSRTGELAALVRRLVRVRPGGIDAATRSFQALRIVVNDELGELERGLAAAESLLRPGGRMVIISFHSLEDRTVKTFFKTQSGGAPRRSRHAPAGGPGPLPSLRLVHRGTITPSAAEIAANPRARSARLRAAERTAAPALGADAALAGGRL